MRTPTLLRDEKGAAATELAFVLLPMCVVLMGLLDVAYMMYARSSLQGALHDIAREAVVESPTIEGTGTVEDRITALVRSRMGKVANGATITVQQGHFSNFSGIGKPEKLITDSNGNGVYDRTTDCFEDMNGNGAFDTAAAPGNNGIGGANDVAVYTAHLSMRRLVPIEALVEWLPTSVDFPSTYEMDATTAVRNQPYGNQVAPPTLCRV